MGRHPVDGLGRVSCVLHLRADVVLRPSHAEGFGLGDGIGQQQAVHVRIGALRLPRRNEFDRMDVRTLVKQLVESVLPIGSGLSPDHGMGGPANRTSVPTHRFAIGFHLRLLEVGGHAMQGLSIGQHHPALHPERIHIPDFNQRQVQRHIGLRVRGLEVAIHGPGPVEQSAEGFAA